MVQAHVSDQGKSRENVSSTCGTNSCFHHAWHFWKNWFKLRIVHHVLHISVSCRWHFSFNHRGTVWAMYFHHNGDGTTSMGHLVLNLMLGRFHPLFFCLVQCTHNSTTIVSQSNDRTLKVYSGAKGAVHCGFLYNVYGMLQNQWDEPNLQAIT